MPIAFIIMQIGNSELDKICEEAILPAIRACGFEPKRIDKHNEGRLLKSEIVNFIESADIIVADLTNERPNCYLEIGYAMGLDKFRNLILTAREDHHHDSPNYKKDGPKIHFDLSGYDILFWDPKDLGTFKSELEKKIKRRIITLPSITSLKKQIWDEDWFSKHNASAFETFKPYGDVPFMEVKSTLINNKPDILQNDLLSLAEKAEIHTFGWPIGVTLGNREEYRPKPRTDGIVAIVNAKDRSSYDYWTIRKNGDFYMLKSLFENERKPGYVFFDTRIVRITEVFLYLSRLYSSMKISPDERFIVYFRHGRLKDYTLTAARPDRFVRDGYKSSEMEVTTQIETSIGDIESNLVSLVEKVTKPLFVVFDYFSLSKDILESIVNNFVDGKVT